jgi:hypothetical protein
METEIRRGKGSRILREEEEFHFEEPRKLEENEESVDRRR